ncbi:alpha/beta fold hydrolase [Nocardia sp. NPDC056000]|uniref:alpha/beta fold hydrolase n=1 Tax=Nocardia sp. NPDC056000 TaxID=3345674 RepID=UPI0035DCD3F6
MPRIQQRRSLRAAVSTGLLIMLTSGLPVPMATAEPLGQPVESSVISADGTTISVKEYGPAYDQAPTVVLVHGWPDNSDVWSKVIPLLADRYHVVNYDPRGSGASDHPDAVSDYELPKLSQDFEAVVDRTAPGVKVHVLAHDWGAIQTWESAARIPEKFSSFTFISGPSLDLLSGSLQREFGNITAWPALYYQAMASSYVPFNYLPVLPEAFWNSGLGAQLMRAYVGLEGGQHEEYSGRDGAAQTNLYRANMFQRLLNPTYDHVEVPVVQQIRPSIDPFVTPVYFNGLENAVPSLWRRTVGVGHWTPLTNPWAVAQYTSELIEFREHGTPAPAGTVVK